MARIRSVKPELPSSKKMAGASIPARYTFILLITQADDEGFVRAEPRQLFGALYPHDEAVTADDLEDWILELVRVKSIALRWTTDGARVIQVLGWEEHQSIKNPGKPKISPTLLPLSEKSPEEIRQASPESGGADVRIFGGSDTRKEDVRKEEVGAAAATSPATTADTTPEPTISDRVRAALPAVARDVFDEFGGDRPDGMARALLTANEPISGGARYTWEQIGQALIDYAGRGHREFVPMLFKRFLETNARPPVVRHADGSADARTRQERNFAAIDEGLRRAAHGQ